MSRRLPGFGLSLGIVLTWLFALLLLPLAALSLKALGAGPGRWLELLSQPRVVAAFATTVGCSLAAALVNAVAGPAIAWILVRYRFPGRALADALVDIPFALPTAVAGITLTALWSPHGLFGRILSPLGVQVAYTPMGIVLALCFVGLPFAVRSAQPVLEEFPDEVEEAAALLGAPRTTTLVRVVLPALRPAVLSGFALSFARGLGEYGSVVFIAGNLPMRTEIVPLLVMQKLEEFHAEDAAVLACALLALSLVSLLGLNALQGRLRRTR